MKYVMTALLTACLFYVIIPTFEIFKLLYIVMAIFLSFGLIINY